MLVYYNDFEMELTLAFQELEHDFLYYMMKSASLISMDKIKRNINDLIDIDYKIKSGQVDKTIALETYLLK